ncbi:hypothetical protein KCP76_04890 [Salmonella enterica subsp. enterica serovar Weltevreden]|nr:hypothetical protein KCP76_04890 [Salmonella enterica subsp. enterica serovar Weltevreden]
MLTGAEVFLYPSRCTIAQPELVCYPHPYCAVLVRQPSSATMRALS